MISRISLAAAALAALALPVLGGTYDPEKLMAHEFEIQKKTLKTVNERITPEVVANQYRLKTPVVPPRLGKNQVEALIAKEVEARVEQKYPLSKFQDFEVNAKKRYQMYRVGQKVALQVRDPRRNKWTKVFETIRQITPKGVRLGDRFFIYSDVHSSEYPHFFKGAHDKAIEQDISNNTANYKRARKEYEQKMKAKLSREIWQAEGYVYRRSKRTWVPKEDVFNYLYERAWKHAYEQLREQVKVDVYEAAGFEWNEGNQRWETPTPPGEEVAVQGDDDDDTASPPAAQPGGGKEPGIDNWKSKLEELWKSKDDDGDEDIWDTEDEKAGDDEDPFAEKPKETTKKPAPKPKSDASKKQEDLFGGD